MKDVLLSYNGKSRKICLRVNNVQYQASNPHNNGVWLFAKSTGYKHDWNRKTQDEIFAGTDDEAIIKVLQMALDSERKMRATRPE